MTARSAAAVLVVLLLLGACSGGEGAGQATADPTGPVTVDPEGGESKTGAMTTLAVDVYYSDPRSRGLVAESHEIFATALPGDRAKQILADLIAGPNGDDALGTLPFNTRLRQVYVLDDGVAWVDFSRELKSGMTGGSRAELLAVYAIVNSVVLNVSEIKRVGILIGGQPIETLNGHLDLTRPLPPNTSLIVSRTV